MIIKKRGGMNEGETHTTSADLCGSWSLILDLQSIRICYYYLLGILSRGNFLKGYASSRYGIG